MDVRGIGFSLQEYRHQASPAEKNVVDYVLKHPNDVVGTSIHDLAAQTYSSTSTIVRLCRKLGLTGYKEFQRGLVYELAQDQRSKSIALSDIRPQDGTKEVIRKVTSKNIASLSATAQLIDAETIDACVNLMARANTINLFGIGASLLVAKDLQLKLLRVNARCNLCDDWHSQLLYAKNMSPDDLAIAVSYSGLTREVIACAETAKECGAPVIAITRGGFDSDLARHSDQVVGVAATELIMRSGAMSSRIAQLNAVDILYTAFVNRDYEHYLDVFVENHIDKPAEGRDQEGDA